MAERVQRHRHTHTCYKYYKPGEDRVCRFDLKEDNFKANSSIDPETGNVCLRCLDGLVNNFNTTILEAVRCNMDIQFIGSGESAIAMIYYVTDYITKSQLKSHVAYAALQLAVKKCEQVDDADDDFTIKSKRLLQKCAYAMISHQEMSAQQVVSYLMDYEDHFMSHRFGNLYWASFERFVDRDDPMQLRNPTADMTRESGGTDHEHAQGEGELENHEPSRDELGNHELSDDTSAEEDDEAEVSITVNKNGDVTELADQVSDYTMRPEEMGSFCLWDFIAKTEKMSGKSGSGTAQLGDDVENPHDKDESDESDKSDIDGSEDLDVVGEKVTSGRKPVTKFSFLKEHKECQRKYMRIRKRNIVPVPIGPSIPRRDQPEVYDRYCRLMLILFKPWRVPVDLHVPGTNWSDAFEEFTAVLPVEHRQIIDNMQVLHECRDSRDDHMQTRTRQRNKSGYRRAFGDGQEAGNEIEEIDMNEVLEHLSELDRMSSKKTDALNREAQQCLAGLERAGWYATDGSSAAGGDSPSESGLNLPDDGVVEDEWRHTYETRKAAWKVEAKHTEDVQETAGAVGILQMDVAEEDVPVINDLESAENSRAEAFDVVAAIDQTVQKWSLNAEQRRAFEIVAHHASEEKPDQLLMHLGGPGGTGKSRVVNALRDFFNLRNETRRFRLAAYTGMAARNIGGATLHALLQMNESGRKVSAKTKRDLAAMWDGVDYLFIDEVSMIGCEFLHNISVSLTEAKGRTAAFGGVNVIFAGDFAQLPPIGDMHLYKDIDTRKATMGSTIRAQAKVLGRLLWLLVDTVVILHETMRQSGSGNTPFVDLLQRLCNGICTNADYRLLTTRSLENLLSPVNDEWRSVPVIVTNNSVRDAINFRATQAFADRMGKELHWYHAIDTHKKSVITDTALIESLESQHSGQMKHRLRRIP